MSIEFINKMIAFFYKWYNSLIIDEKNVLMCLWIVGRIKYYSELANNYHMSISLNYKSLN